jgi:hypothetical protein
LAESDPRVSGRDSLAKIADTKIIGIGIEWYIWYYLSSFVISFVVFLVLEGLNKSDLKTVENIPVEGVLSGYVVILTDLKNMADCYQ